MTKNPGEPDDKPEPEGGRAAAFFVAILPSFLLVFTPTGYELAQSFLKRPSPMAKMIG